MHAYLRTRDRRFWGRLPSAAGVATALLAIAACTGSSSGTATARLEKPDLVIAAVPSESAVGLYLAQADGLFAQAGLHVTIQATTSSSIVIPDLINGTVDVASGQYTSYILADASGMAKMRILAAGLSLGPHVQEILAVGNTPIQNLAGLKGKSIAVNVANGVTTDLLYSALAAYGVTPRQVRVVAIPFPAMPAALAAGRVDAVYEVEPYVSESILNYGFQSLADIDSGATQEFPIAGYGVLKSWAARYPRTAAAFAAAIDQANAIATTDLASFQRALIAELHVSPDVAGVMATGLFPTKVDAVQLQRVADLLLRYGQLRRPFKVESILGA